MTLLRSHKPTSESQLERALTSLLKLPTSSSSEYAASLVLYIVNNKTDFLIYLYTKIIDIDVKYIRFIICKICYVVDI